MAIAAILVSCATERDHYEISGRLEGADGVTILLQEAVGREIVVIDSAVVENGRFTFTGSVDYPKQVVLLARESRQPLAFYLDNAAITVSGNIDQLGSAEVKGGPTQRDMERLSEELSELNDKMQKLSEEMMTAVEAGDNELASSIAGRINEMRPQEREAHMKFIADNPDSFLSLYLLRAHFRGLNPQEAGAIVGGLNPDILDNPVAAEIKEQLARLNAVAVGNVAPDFTLPDVEGNAVSLHSMVGEGYLLIDFWASWCGPCRASSPYKVSTYNAFNDKGFDILSVSLDRNKEDWIKGIEEDGLTWSHLYDDRVTPGASAATLYNVTGIPASFLLDSEGVIVATGLRGQALYNKIEELVGESE